MLVWLRDRYATPAHNAATLNALQKTDAQGGQRSPVSGQELELWLRAQF